MRFLPSALLLLLMTPALSHARVPPVEESKDLWATVNVCDSAAKPNQIGIRASMPGLRRRSRQHVRFRVQYVRPGGGRWRDVAEGGDSGWVLLGSGRKHVVEAGQDFMFTPAQGGTLTLRGVVSFRWRRDGKTVRRVRKTTEAGHTSTRGADPEGYSAATCEIT